MMPKEQFDKRRSIVVSTKLDAFCKFQANLVSPQLLQLLQSVLAAFGSAFGRSGNARFFAGASASEGFGRPTKGFIPVFRKVLAFRSNF